MSSVRGCVAESPHVGETETMSLASVAFAIPSPSRNSIGVGDFRIRAYGLMIGLGAVLAVKLAQRRWRHVGGRDDEIASIAGWAVPAGVVGARMYHVATDWRSFRGKWLDVFKIWEGGLGIPGGLVAGIGLGYLLARRRGLRLGALLVAVVPAIPLAQAVGRLGNWFNQELFGRPTTLPWALRIDPLHRPVGYGQFATFHPTFLYEALWNLALMGVLILLTKRSSWVRERVLALYIVGYAVGRMAVESLRIDHASVVLGLRINIWTSLLAIVCGGAFLARRSRQVAPARLDVPLDGVAYDEVS